MKEMSFGRKCLGKTKDKRGPHIGRSNLPKWTIWRQESSCWDTGNSCISSTEQVSNQMFQDQGWSRKQEEVFSFHNTWWDDCRARPMSSAQMCVTHVTCVALKVVSSLQTSFIMMDVGLLRNGDQETLSLESASFLSGSNFRSQ